MADTPLTTSLITIAQNYAGDIVRQVNRTAVLLKILAPTFREGEGGNVALVAESSGAVAETFSEGADPSNFGSDKQAPATLPFGRYWAPWHVTGSAMASAATSRTPAGNIRLWARQMVNASEALAKLMNTDCYTGAGGDAFVGLDAAIGSTSNTYGTIDRSQGGNAYWRPTVVDSSGAAITFAAIRSDLAAIKKASGYKPDFAMVSSNTLNTLAALFDPQKQYVFQVVNTVGTATSDIMLDGGTGAIRFDGCTFVEDVFCPDNAIYYCNSRHIRIEYLPAELSLAMFPSDEAMALGGLTDGFDTIPLGVILELLAKTGDSQKAYLKCYPQLAVDRPNACGKRFNFA
jgi:hypothetical protein